MVESRCDGCKAYQNRSKSPGFPIDGVDWRLNWRKGALQNIATKFIYKFFCFVSTIILKRSKMKKTLIATAVSAALMAPVAAQADVTVYGRIHQGIKFVNPEKGKSTTDFVGIGSRFGIKASSDLGNGMTASAQYEFATSTDAPRSGVVSTRVAKVGVSGSFGSIDLGNQWSAWYNIVGMHVDPTFSVGGLYHIGPFRTANTIKYSNSFGPVSLELDSRIDDAMDGGAANGGDGYAVAANIAVNDNISVAAGIDDTDARTLTGAAVKVSLGSYWASIARQSQDPDGPGAKPSTTSFWVGGSFGNTSAILGTGRRDNDGVDSDPGNDPGDITLGVYHDLGGGLKLLYEGNKNDVDGAAGGDTTTHLFGVRLDF